MPCKAMALTNKFAIFFMRRIPLHTQELFSEIIIVFHHVIVSEVRILLL